MQRSINYVRNTIVSIILIGLTLWSFNLNDKINHLEENNKLVMEFSILQADKINRLSNECSETSKQIAAMCSVCTENFKIEEQDIYSTDSTQ